MDFTLAITLGEILGIVIGGISATVDVIGFLSQYRNFSLLQTIKSSLESQAIALRGSLEKEEHELLELLARSQIIAPHLKEKLVTRFATSLILIVSSSIFVAADRPGEIFSRYQGFESVDILAILFQIGLAILNFTTIALRKEEKLFLVNASAVQDAYYEKFVFPAIDEFNKSVPKLKLLRDTRHKTFRQQEELERQVRNIVSDELRRRENDS